MRKNNSNPLQNLFKTAINVFSSGLPTLELVKLLAFPIILSFTGVVITSRVQEENRQTQVLNKYFEQMDKLFLNPNLDLAESDNSVRLLIKSRSVATLRNVNLTRKEVIISFLHELNMLNSSSEETSLNLDYFNLTEKYFDLTKIGTRFQNLRGINLSGFDLRDVSLRNSNLTRSNLERANLNGAILDGAILEGAILKEADLSEANLNEANLNGANLEGADLDEAYIFEANLSGANLEKADLSEVTLDKANLRDANLSGAYLNQAYLDGANLSGANLREANLSGAYLDQANLSGANLEEADLEKADLQEADLYRANLRGANLKGANLYKTKSLNKNQLKLTYNWEEAIYTEAKWDVETRQLVPKDKEANEAKIQQIRDSN